MDELEMVMVQEQSLRLASFDHDAAWRLGSRLRELAMIGGHSIAIDVEVAREPRFFHAMAGTTSDNVEWIRRKRNVVRRFQRSSYAIGLELLAAGATLEQRYSVSEADHAAHGGSFPITLAATGCIGTVTVSGLPQRVDHELVVTALAELVGIDPATLALPAR